MRDRLIELIKQAKKHARNTNCDIARNMIFADYLLANGVVLPPCKVGTKVYAIRLGKIYEWDVVSFIVDGDGVSYINLAYMGGNNMYRNTYEVYEIGKTVFLSREEAEKALRGYAE